MRLKVFLIFIILTFLLFFSSVIYLFHQDTSYEKILKIKNSLGRETVIGKFYSFGFKIIRYASNKLDVAKVYYKIKNEEPASVNLQLSNEDVADMGSQIEVFIKKDFIKDELNYWRKAKLKKGNKEFKIKYKFNGTSVSSLKKGHSSFRIKFAKEQYYIDKIREFNLIKIYFDGDENIPTIIFNNLANKIGLLSPVGETTILKINGVTEGFYYKQERHGKEWFEKKQITNYSILKTNDDWDKKKRGHQSDLDLNEKNIEISGTGVNTDIAVGGIKNLFDAINSKDIKKIFRLIDKDYFAKFLALSVLVNDNHAITGDNLKFIYDYTTGKFKVLFRQEGGIIIPIRANLENFNNAFFENNSSYKNAISHNLFKLILTDNDFRLKRDFYLNQVATNKKNIIKEAEKTYNNSYKNIIFSDLKLRHQKYLKNNFFNDLNNNFDKIDKYLNYVKIYVSKEKKENFSNLSLINDSYIPHRLKAIYFGKEKMDLKDRDEYLLSSIIVNKKKYDYAEKIINILSSKDITKIELENILTKRIIKQEHIYINKIKNYELTDQESLINSLEINNINYNFNGKELIIKKGNYILNKNIIVSPNVKTIIEKGTKFKLNKNISILIQGDLYAEGTEEEYISVSRHEKKSAFGTFAIIGKDNKIQVKLTNFIIEGGSEALIEGMVFLGQLSIHNSELQINNSKIMRSISDDGANIRNSYVEIFNTTFSDNKSDHLDLDFCSGKIANNIFISNENLKITDDNNIDFSGDGIDLSGSNIIIKNNKIINSKDKGLSIGEKSKVLVEKNYFEGNNTAIAIKDESTSYIVKNEYFNNDLNYSMYIKKFIFDKPNLYLNKNDYTNEEIILLGEKKNIKNFQFDEGTIYFIDKLNQKSFYEQFKNEITSSRI
jgi:hypothetical protein